MRLAGLPTASQYQCASFLQAGWCSLVVPKPAFPPQDFSGPRLCPAASVSLPIQCPCVKRALSDVPATLPSKRRQCVSAHTGACTIGVAKRGPYTDSSQARRMTL